MKSRRGCSKEVYWNKLENKQKQMNLIRKCFAKIYWLVILFQVIIVVNSILASDIF